MLVRDRMECDLVTTVPAARCDRVLALMEAAGVDTLPVLEGERLVGLVSELEIHRQMPRGKHTNGGESGDLLPYVQVAGVMTYAPVTVDPGTPLITAAERMLESGLTALPVVEANRLTGMLGIRSILEALLVILGERHSADRAVNH